MSLAVYVSAAPARSAAWPSARSRGPPGQRLRSARGAPAATRQAAPLPRGRRLGVRRRVDDLALALQPAEDARARPRDRARRGRRPAAGPGSRHGAADDERHGQAQRQGQEPLLAARGRGPRVGAPEAHGDVVPMGAPPRQPPPEVARPRRRPARPGAPGVSRPRSARRGDRRLVAQRHAGAVGGQRELDLADGVRQEGQRLEPPMHDLAARAPRAARPRAPGAASPSGRPIEVAQEARPLLKRQPIAAARLAMRGHEAGRRAVEIGAPEMRAAREQAPGRTPRSSRRRPTGRASLAPRPLPRARAARAARRASGSPRRARPPPWPGRRHPTRDNRRAWPCGRIARSAGRRAPRGATSCPGRCGRRGH